MNEIFIQQTLGDPETNPFCSFLNIQHLAWGPDPGQINQEEAQGPSHGHGLSSSRKRWGEALMVKCARPGFECNSSACLLEGPGPDIFPSLSLSFLVWKLVTEGCGEDCGMW